jgi:hypothetical protein
LAGYGELAAIYGKPGCGAAPNRTANCYMVETKSLSETAGLDAVLLRYAPEFCTIHAQAQDFSRCVAGM